jgi:hypothetical protein
VLGFSTPSSHAWRRSPVSTPDWDDAHLINAVLDVCATCPEFGHRLNDDELIHAKGFDVSENRDQGLWDLQGISSSIIKRRGPALPCLKFM